MSYDLEDMRIGQLTTPFSTPVSPLHHRPAASEATPATAEEVLFDGPQPSVVELFKVRLPAGSKSAPAVGPDGRIAVVHEKGVTVLGRGGSQEFRINGRPEVKAQPAFGADGTLYVCNDYRPGLQAFDRTGKLKWETDQSWIYTSDIGPQLDGDQILFGEGNGQVRSFAKDGKQNWSFDTRGERVLGDIWELSVADGVAYAVSDKNRLFAIKDGQELWSTPPRDHHSSVRLGTQVVARNGSLYFCDWSGNLRKQNLDGEQEWRFAFRFMRREEEIATEELIPPKEPDGLWEKLGVLVGGGEPEPTREEALARLNTNDPTTGFGSTPAFSPDGKTIYVADSCRPMQGAPQLTAIDAESAKHLWSTTLSISSNASDVQVDEAGNIYVGSDYGRSVVCFSPNGERRWTFHSPGERGHVGLTLDGDRVILGTESGWMHVLSSQALQERNAGLEGEPEIIHLEGGDLQIGDFELDYKD